MTHVCFKIVWHEKVFYKSIFIGSCVLAVQLEIFIFLI